jgi:hypothetical protein
LLERVTDDGATAEYRVVIATPTDELESTATLSDDGEVKLVPTGAPAQLDGALTMFARLVARGASKRRDDGMPVWPQRVLRWRPG